jgi:hypothetical protein
MGSEHADMWDGKARAEKLFFYEQNGRFYRKDLQSTRRVGKEQLPHKSFFRKSQYHATIHQPT